MRRMVLFGIAVVAAMQMAGATAADAAYPGSNGLIAFVRAGDIWTISPSSRVQKRLTFTTNNSTPVWSPSGKLIAFTSSRAGSADIWVMNANGTSPHRITTASTVEQSPTWSPDGKWLAFSSARGPTHEFAIFKIRSTYPYGTAIRLTTPPPPWDVYDTYADKSPTWSPLGGDIVFSRYSPLSEPPGTEIDMERVASSGGTDTPLYPGGDSIGDQFSPDYAPRGQAIAFMSDYDTFYDGPYRIWILGADGSKPHRLTTNANGGDLPSWAPSGTIVTYSNYSGCTVTPCTPNVWTIHSDGTNAKLLVKNADDPNWQPIPKP